MVFISTSKRTHTHYRTNNEHNQASRHASKQDHTQHTRPPTTQIRRGHAARIARTKLWGTVFRPDGDSASSDTIVREGQAFKDYADDSYTERGWIHSPHNVIGPCCVLSIGARVCALCVMVHVVFGLRACGTCRVLVPCVWYMPGVGFVPMAHVVFGFRASCT